MLHVTAIIASTAGIIIILVTMVTLMATTVAGEQWTVILHRHIHTIALMIIDHQIEMEHTTCINRITTPRSTLVHQSAIRSIRTIIIIIIIPTEEDTLI
jgi:hypothetical protein